MRSCALILPLPLPLLMGFSTKAVRPPRTVTGGELACPQHTVRHVRVGPQHAGLLQGKTELDWNV